MTHKQSSPEIIRVTLERYKNGYLATSNSLKGLFVSHQSLAKVYDSIPVAIRLLYKAEHGIDVVVKEANEPTQGVHPLHNIDFIAEAA